MNAVFLAVAAAAAAASLLLLYSGQWQVSVTVPSSATELADEHHSALLHGVHDCTSCTVVNAGLTRDLSEWPAITAVTLNATILTVQATIVASLVRIVSDGANVSMFVDPPRLTDGKPAPFYFGMDDMLHGIHEAATILAQRGQRFDVWFGLNAGDFGIVHRHGDARSACNPNLDTELESSSKAASTVGNPRSLRDSDVTVKVSSSSTLSGIDAKTPLVFGTNRDCGRGAQVLAPNMEFYRDFVFGTRYAQVVNASATPWNNRSTLPFWRGGANCRRYGRYVDASINQSRLEQPGVADCIRLDLHKWCTDRKWVERGLADVGYVRDHRSCENGFTVGLSCADYPPKEPSDVWTWTDRAIAFHPSGHTYSSRLYKVMAVGAAVLLDDDPNDEFFYSALRPGRNFIPFDRVAIETLLQTIHDATASPSRSFPARGLPYRGQSLDVMVSKSMLEQMGARNSAFVREQLNSQCIRCYWMRALQLLATAQSGSVDCDGAALARWGPPLVRVEEACEWARAESANPRPLTSTDAAGVSTTPPDSELKLLPHSDWQLRSHGGPSVAELIGAAMLAATTAVAAIKLLGNCCRRRCSWYTTQRASDNGQHLGGDHHDGHRDAGGEEAHRLGAAGSD